MGARRSGEVGKSSDAGGKLADTASILWPVIGGRLNGLELKGEVISTLQSRRDFLSLKFTRALVPSRRGAQTCAQTRSQLVSV